MSLHRTNRSAIAQYVSGSACSNTVSVSSENTTPNPKASFGARRSNNVTSQSGRILRIRIEK